MPLTEEQRKERRREYREINKEKIKEANRKYREANKDKLKEVNKKYREANKERERERNKKYREANKERERERNKKYREANKEKIKKYREANKEREMERNKKYREANKEKVHMSNTISKWKRQGLIHDDYKSLYDKVMNTDYCERCNCKLTGTKPMTGTSRCMDHDHITGKFRGVVCHSCNSSLPKQPKKINNIKIDEN